MPGFSWFSRWYLPRKSDTVGSIESPFTKDQPDFEAAQTSATKKQSNVEVADPLTTTDHPSTEAAGPMQHSQTDPRASSDLVLISDREKVKLVKRQGKSISHTHYQLVKWCPKLREERNAYIRNANRCLMQHPVHNLILSETGRPRFQYEKYQTEFEISVLIREYEQDLLKREQRKVGVENRWKYIAMLRITSACGLREWEWSAGEPLPTSENDEAIGDGRETDPKSAQLTTTDSLRRKLSDSASSNPTYAERVRNFTYTYGNDPMWKGRKYIRDRRRRTQIVFQHGDWSDQVSLEDQMYEPEKEESFITLSKGPFRETPSEAEAKAVARQPEPNIGAGDLLFGAGRPQVPDFVPVATPVAVPAPVQVTVQEVGIAGH